MRSRLVLLGLSAALGLFCLAVSSLAGSASGAEASAPPDTGGDAGATVVTLPPDPNATTVPPSTVPVDPATGLPLAQGPLVVLPAGCVTPSQPLAVFEGVIDASVANTARFRVTRLLSGSLQGYEVGALVDVQYGNETRFLEVGTTYIVGVGASAATGGLVSTVREPAPLFGGDAVVGANDSDVDCVIIDDPVRTLTVNGTSVDTGVLAPLRGEGKSLLSAVLRPLAVAFGVLLALVTVKLLVFAIGRALRDMGDSEPVGRSRHHQVDLDADRADSDRADSDRAETSL
jgi:hypothetical protein